MSRIRMSHVAHTNESCYTYECVMSHIWTTSLSKCKLWLVVSHIWRSHVAHMNQSCHTYEWVLSHISMSHVTNINESWHTYGWVMSHIWMSHVTHMNESWHAYEWAMSRIWMSNFTRMNESCHAYECVMSHIWMSHIWGQIWLMASDTTHSYVWHDSFVCVAWFIRTCDVPDSRAKILQTLCPQIMHVTHTNEPCSTYEWVSRIRMSLVSHIRMSHATHTWTCHVTHMDKSCHAYEFDWSWYARMN